MSHCATRGALSLQLSIAMRSTFWIDTLDYATAQHHVVELLAERLAVIVTRLDCQLILNNQAFQFIGLGFETAYLEHTIMFASPRPLL